MKTKRRTVLVVFAALLAFGVFSLVVTSTELSALDLAARWGKDRGGHSEVVAKWQGEADRDRLVARENRPGKQPPAVLPGLNVGRVLAKYDKEDKDSGNVDPGTPAAVVKSSPGKTSSSEQDRQSYEKYLELQLNWTSSLISSSSKYSELSDKLRTLDDLKNRELRMDTSMRELWLYLRDQLQGTSKKTAGADDTKTKLLRGIKEQLDLLSVHMSDTQKAMDYFIKPRWRDTLAEEMTKLMHKRLQHLQNPDNCHTAKKLLCRISKPCGFGCQMHHVAYCFIFAYATKRVLVLESKGWRYSGEWESAFQPLSASGCNNAGGDAYSWHSFNTVNPPNVIQVPAIESLGYSRPPFLPMAVPADLVERLKAFHGYPFVWFVGQFLQYLMRPSKQLKDYLDDRQRALNITHPIVGVHIRRTDKLQQEASYHSAQEYMTQVEEWFQKRETIYGKKEQRTVYLASDDKLALSEARGLYPNYRFISDNDVSKTAGDLGSRYSEMGLYGVVLDVFMLSKCDYIVCTLSSQVCRLAYELMQAHHTDASRLVYSLDDVYYYGGQLEHVLRAFHGKTENGGGSMEFEEGDLVKIAGNHLNGFSLGSKQKSSQRALFPSYKFEEEIRVANFPTYPEAL